MTKKELVENKFPIDKNYHEQMNLDDILQFENELEFYERSHAVAASILKSHENELIQYIHQGQVTPQHHLHVLFIGKIFLSVLFFFRIEIISYSTCTEFGNMYTKIMRRQISTGFIGLCYS